jgi:diaminohydroxyphosphoribosylaminopyrimidine deaminase/5-amino-6-(5-phosphoribosylamino)uracil reductase
MEQGLPYMRCKLAMSLDGRTAMASGESKWITSEAARGDVQRLRARSSAVLTGLGTVRADDPSMNVRIDPDALPEITDTAGLRQPVRVVLDPQLEMSADARMLALPGQTLVLCTDAGAHRADPLESAGARVVTLPEDHGHVDLEAALRYLAREEINEVLLEAGPTLAGAALAGGLIDELVVYLAPHIMGHGARGLFYLPALARMEDRIGLKITDVRPVGEDWRITARPLAP